jgi:DNA-binding NarL/FixJ family response regulator
LIKPIRLVVVDDHALFRAGLISLLGAMEEFDVIGEAGDGKSALNVIRTQKPDVVLLDVNMPEMGGVETVKAIRSHNEVCRVLMLTISKSDEDLFGAITAGADGYLLKNAEPEELRKSILLVHQGFSVLSPLVTRQVLKKVTSEKSSENDLSDREIEVLECLSQGLTTAQIGAELYISENTVKTHVRHILEKLEASNRVEAVKKATVMGLFTQND